MQTSVTSLWKDKIIPIVLNAERRLVVIAPPSLTPNAARAIAPRMDDHPELALTIIMDPDPAVYQENVCGIEAFEIIQSAAAMTDFTLREQPGIRIGAIIADDEIIIDAG